MQSSSARLTVSRLITLAMAVTLVAACGSSAPRPAASGSAVPSSAVASSVAASAAGSASATPSPSAPTSSEAAPSSPPASGSTKPDAASSVSVRLTRSHRVVKGNVGTVDIDQLSVVGLPAAVSAALQAPVAAALADYTTYVTSSPCSAPTCTNGDFQADFTTDRADAAFVSGTWTILTFFPGAAHPSTQLTSVIVNATDGTTIKPAQLFAGNSLITLAAATLPIARAKLTAIGCTSGDDSELIDGTAAKTENYVATAVTAAGLLIGLSDSQVAAHACGTFDLMVPWSDVRSNLSALGASVAAPVPIPTPAAPAAASAPTTAAPRCATTSLAVTVGPTTPTAATQYQLPIVFTNIGSAPCSLLGFPGADLDAAGTLPLSLRRAAGTPARVILAPDSQAHANLTYLAGPDPTCDSGGPWTPATLTITPPDETTSVQLPWLGGSVDDCQSGATHPGSYIGLIVAG